MKLVIDIDEETYKAIVKPFHALKGQRSCKSVITDACISIAMGKPLPKGHGRLIDADTLVDGFEDNFEFCEALNATPTIIEADKESAE